MADFQEIFLGEILAIAHDECTISSAFNMKEDKTDLFKDAIEKVINNHLNQKRFCKSALMADALFACNAQSILEVFVVGQMVGIAFVQLAEEGIIDK
jgi:hypothetical protein